MSHITLKLGSNISRDTVISKLVDLGYERVSMVIEPGTFSVKGSVVDCFPVNQNQPVRCDFFGDEMDRLGSFRVDTQRTLSELKQTKIVSVDVSNMRRLEYDARLLDSEVMSNINVGDYIVHERVGIGQFAGFCRLTVGDKEGEYVRLHFKGTDKLFMPLDQIPLIHRYAGSDATPRLNGLTDGSWKRQCQKAHRALATLAEDIYRLFKDRQICKGVACGPDTELQLRFEQGFPYTETPDQLTAIRDIKADMEASRPMDRLVCGDVGFGKTELIMRAAVKGVCNNHQVMVLVPTTILSEQHYRSFLERCDGLGIAVGVVSRLKSVKHNKQVLKQLAQGSLDIIIGTHRLLQADVQFKRLGLIVVDEEQRFGVRHKEKIKALSPNIDCLTTSATPIPRTLYMSLTGARAMSTLRTPPPGRTPIHTVISEYSADLIKEAIQRELDRGGQIYFLHNHITELATIQSQLLTWFPNLRIGVAHGQMGATELDNVMVSFYANDCDVLLCTTIIENGLDIQNANTIILNRADRLGLSQIHQIRGRVGRCSIQAYAYILFPQVDHLTAESRGRLQALKEAVGLGVGYQLAMKDLEIRGAGTLLGERQSGHLTSIGFDLYCKLLERNLKKVRGVGVQEEVLVSLADCPNVFIPATYIESDQERLAMYQRLLRVKNRSQVRALALECEDRFGRMPKSMLDFVQVIEGKVGFV